MAALSNRSFYFLNALISIFALSFLSWLIFFQEGSSDTNLAVSMIPAVNAGLNATAAVLLVLGFRAIRSGREATHRNLMLAAFVVSALFLIGYIYYHSLQGDTRFLGEGWIRPVYFFILITHIVLSMVLLPLVLSSIFFGLSDRRATHRKVAKITLPIWLYVSITGVIIFFLLRWFS